MYDKRIAEPEFAAQIAKKQKHLRNANTIIGGAGCLGMMLGGIIFLMMTAGITMLLGAPALIVCFGIIPACFQWYAHTGKHRTLLQAVRALGITLLACIVLAPFICNHRALERIPLLYPIKRFVFDIGVKHTPLAEVMLPYWLPRQHDTYFFRTEPDMVAQDYTPYAYLFLHTDEETLRAYEQKLSHDPNLERLQNRSYSPDSLQKMIEKGAIYSEEWAQYQHFPNWMYAIMTEHAEIHDDLSHAVIFRSGNAGALINFETGLLTVWL